MELYSLVNITTKSHGMLATRLLGRTIRSRPICLIPKPAAAHYAQYASTNDAPDYVKRIQDELEQLKPMDKAHLLLTYEAYDKIEQWVRRNCGDVRKPAERLQTAGPRDYITLSSSQTIYSELLDAMAVLKAHLQDLQTEPYVDYDYNIDNVVLSDREIEDLDLQARDAQDRLMRDAGLLNKYTSIMSDAAYMIEKGGRGFDLDKFLNERIANVQSEEAGVTYSDKMEKPVFRGRSRRGEKRIPLPSQEQKPAAPGKRMRGGAKIKQSKLDQAKTDQSKNVDPKKKGNASNDWAWTDHDALLESDSQGFGDSPSDL